MISPGWREWSALELVVEKCKNSNKRILRYAVNQFSKFHKVDSLKLTSTDELNSTEICRRNRPGVFSRVKCFVRWIKKVQRRIESQSKTSTTTTSTTSTTSTTTTTTTPRTNPPPQPQPTATQFPQTHPTGRRPREREQPKGQPMEKNLTEKRDKPPDLIGAIGHKINEITKQLVKPLEIFGIMSSG